MRPTISLTVQATLELFGDDDAVELRPCETIKGASKMSDAR